MARLQLAELISSFSYALDLTEGQPAGHCVRCCWIGMHIGRQLGLRDEELWALYYALLLKDLGCSSNAARICELYVTDDRAFKQAYKLAGTKTSEVFAFVVCKTGPHAGWRRRFGAILNIVRNGDSVAQELIETRCSRGASIARQLHFPDSVADAIYSLDEHFDGTGRPDHLCKDDIPLASRIALMAQVIDVFHFSDGEATAIAEVGKRAGTWFDPNVVAAFEVVATNPAFWIGLTSDDVEARVRKLAPPGSDAELDEEFLDDIAVAFGEVVDAKSPFTAGHSQRVSVYADLIAEELGLSNERRRWLHRAAVLHDVGKLGVSNSILDKPGRLDAEEWAAVQKHAAYTEEILLRIGPFAELARMAGAHHEKLDGTGYPRGLGADDIALETRIITVADVFDAISAKRPYHEATSIEGTLEIMRPFVGTAFDAECFKALELVVNRPDRLKDKSAETTELAIALTTS